MDTVIKKISEIEEATSSIMEAANIRKKAFAQELAKRTEDFDHQLDLMTEQQLTDLRARMETEMQAKLSKQQSDADQLLQQMESNYNEHHTEYAKELFQSLIEE